MTVRLRKGAKRVSIVVDKESWNKLQAILKSIEAPKDMASRMINEHLKDLNAGLTDFTERFSTDGSKATFMDAFRADLSQFTKKAP